MSSSSSGGGRRGTGRGHSHEASSSSSSSSSSSKSGSIQATSGGKRKLVVDSDFDMHSEDGSQKPNPAQKMPRVEDDTLSKFLHLVQRTFETPASTNLGGSPLVALLTDVIIDIDRILADPTLSSLAELGSDHIHRLVAIIELVLSDVAPAPWGHEKMMMDDDDVTSESLASSSSSASSRRRSRSGVPPPPPSSSSSSEAGGYRIRSAAMGFLGTALLYIKDHLLESPRAYDAMSKAIALLETLEAERTDGIGAIARARTAVSRSTLLAGLSGICPAFHSLPISREVQTKVHSFVFGGMTPSPPRTTSHHRKPPASSSLDLFSGLSLPLTSDYELQLESAGQRSQTGTSSSASRPDTRGSIRDQEAASLAVLQRCSGKVIDLAIGLLACPLAPRVFSPSTTTTTSSPGTEEGPPAVLTTDPDVLGASQMMGLVSRIIHLILGLEAETRGVLNASHPFPLRGSASTIQKCIELGVLLINVYDSSMARARELLATQASKGNIAPFTHLLPEAQGGRFFCSTNANAFEDVLSIVGLHDTDTDPSTSIASILRLFVAGRLLASFPRASHLALILHSEDHQRSTRSSTRVDSCPISAEIALLACSVLYDQLKDGKAGEQIGEVGSSAAGSASDMAAGGMAADEISSPFTQAKRAMGRSAATRASWLLSMLGQSALDSLLASLAQTLRAAEGSENGVIKSLVTGLLSLLPIVSGISGTKTSSDEGTTTRQAHEAILSLRINALHDAAVRLGQFSSTPPSYVNVCLAILGPIVKECGDSGAGEGLGKHLVARMGDTGAKGLRWPIFLPLPSCLLIASLTAAGLDMSDSPLPDQIISGLLSSITDLIRDHEQNKMDADGDAMKEKEMEEEDQGLGLAHARLLALLGRCQPQQVRGPQIGPLLSVTAKLAGEGPSRPRLVAHLLLLIESLLNATSASIASSAAVNDVGSSPSSTKGLDVLLAAPTEDLSKPPSLDPLLSDLSTVEGDQQHDDLTAALTSFGVDPQARVSLAASVGKVISGWSHGGPMALLCLRVVRRLACCTDNLRFIDLPQLLPALPGLEAIDRLSRMSATMDHQESPGAAEVDLVGPVVQSLANQLIILGQNSEEVVAEEGKEGSKAKSFGNLEHGVEESLVHIFGRALSHLKTFSDLAEAAQKLTYLLNYALRKQRTTLKQAIRAVWAQCDPAALFEEEDDHPALMDRLVYLTSCVLRLGREEPHLRAVAGSLVALHEGVAALDGERSETMAPPIPSSSAASARGGASLSAAVNDALGAHVKMTLPSSQSDLDDSVQAPLTRVIGLQRLLAALIGAAEEIGSKSRTLLACLSTKGDADVGAFGHATDGLAGAIGFISADATLGWLAARCERALASLGKIAADVRSARRLELAAEALRLAAGIDDHRTGDLHQHQLLVVVGSGLLTQALEEYAGCMSSDKGRATVVSHLLGTRGGYGEQAAAIHRLLGDEGAIEGLLSLLKTTSTEHVEGQTQAHVRAAMVHLLAGICPAEEEVTGMEVGFMEVAAQTCAYLARVGQEKLTDLIRTCLRSSPESMLSCSFAHLCKSLVEVDGLGQPGRELGPFCRALVPALQIILPDLIYDADHVALGLHHLLCCLGMAMGEGAKVAEALLACAEREGSSAEIRARCLEMLEAMLVVDGEVEIKMEEELLTEGSGRGAGVREGGDASAMEINPMGESQGGSELGRRPPQHALYICHTCQANMRLGGAVAGSSKENGFCTACANVCHRGHDLSYLGSSSSSSPAAGGCNQGCSCPAAGLPSLSSSSAPSHCLSLKSNLGAVVISTKAKGIKAWRYAEEGSQALVAALRVVRKRHPNNARGAAIITNVKNLISRASFLTRSILRTGGRGSMRDSGQRRDRPSHMTLMDSLRRPSAGLRLEKTFSVLRPSRQLEAGSFEVRSVGDNARSRQLKALIASGHARRSILSADGKGKIAFVEQDQVIIASALSLLAPAVMPSAERATSSSGLGGAGGRAGGGEQMPLRSVRPPPKGGRSKLCILSRAQLSFHPLGLLFNPAYPSHLVVWGLRDCLVLTLDEAGRITQRSNIDPSFDAITFSGVVKQVRWVPGTHTQLCVMTDVSIKFFDSIRQCGSATHAYRSSSQDPVIMDAVLIPAPTTPSTSSNRTVGPSPPPIVKSEPDEEESSPSSSQESLGIVLLVLTKSMRLYIVRPGKGASGPGTTVEHRLEPSSSVPLSLPSGVNTGDDSPISLHYSSALRLVLIGLNDRIIGFRIDSSYSRLDRGFSLLSSTSLATAASSTTADEMRAGGGGGQEEGGSSQSQQQSAYATGGPFVRFCDCPPSASGSSSPILMLIAKAPRLRSERPFALALPLGRETDRLLVQEARWRVGGPEGSGSIEGMCFHVPEGLKVAPIFLVLYENGSLQTFVGGDGEGLFSATSSKQAEATIINMNKKVAYEGPDAATALRALVRKRIAPGSTAALSAGVASPASSSLPPLSEDGLMDDMRGGGGFNRRAGMRSVHDDLMEMTVPKARGMPFWMRDVEEEDDDEEAMLMEESLSRLASAPSSSASRPLSRGGGGEGGGGGGGSMAPGGPWPPITQIEQLARVGAVHGLEFLGEHCSDAARERLVGQTHEVDSDEELEERHDDMSLTSALVGSRNEGLTIAIRLPEESGYEIAHVRVLLGASGSETIPREVRLLARARRVAPGKKRWYDLPLTEEEIRVADHAGMMTLSLGETIEPGLSPVLDAVQVYARRKEGGSHHFMNRQQQQQLSSLSMSQTSSASRADVSSGGPIVASQPWERAAIAAIRVLKETLVRGIGPQSPRSSVVVEEAMSAVSAVFAGTWNGAPDRRAVREAGKEVLHQLCPSPIDYSKAKDRMQLAFVRELLATSAPVREGGLAVALADLSAAVTLIRRVLSRRSANLYEGSTSGDLLFRCCVDRLLRLAEVPRSSSSSTGSTLGEQMEGVAGEVVELGLREIAHAINQSEPGLEAGLDLFVRLVDSRSALISSALGLRIARMLKQRIVLTPPLASDRDAASDGRLKVGRKSNKEVGGIGVARFFKSTTREQGDEEEEEEEDDDDDEENDDDNNAFLSEARSAASLRMVKQESGEEEVSSSNHNEDPADALKYRCDCCDQFPLKHVRYCCDICSDFDLCEACYARGDVLMESHGPHHPMSRIRFDTDETGAAISISNKNESLSSRTPAGAAASDEEDDDADVMDVVVKTEVGSPDTVDQEQDEEAADNDTDLREMRPSSAEATIGGGIASEDAMGVVGGSTDELIGLDSVLKALYARLLAGLPKALGVTSYRWSPEPVVNRLSLLLQLLTSVEEAEQEGEGEKEEDQEQKEEGSTTESMVCNLVEVLCTCLASSLTRLKEEGRTQAANRQSLGRTPTSDVTLLLSRALDYIVSASSSSAPSSSSSISSRASTPSTLPSEETQTSIAASSGLVCKAHGLPLAKRVWSHGRYRGRPFLSCSLPRDRRCQHFAWAGPPPDSSDDSLRNKPSTGEGTNNPSFSSSSKDKSLLSGCAPPGLLLAGKKIRDAMTARGGQRIEALICTLVEKWLDTPSITSSTSSGGTGGGRSGSNSSPSLPSASKDAIRAAWPRPRLADTATAHEAQMNRVLALLREAGPSLLASLLSLLASARKSFGSSLAPMRMPAARQEEMPATSEAGEKWDGAWPRRLCEVIEGRQQQPSGSSTSPPLALKSSAKRLLRALMGGRPAYQRVRDLFTFTRSLRIILRVVARAQKGLGGKGGADDEETVPPKIRVLELLYADQVRLQASLTTLSRVAHVRPDNWKIMGTLTKFPFQLNGPEDGEGEEQSSIMTTGPLCAVFDLCTVLDGKAQLTCLTLLELASSPAGQIDEEMMAGLVAGRQGGGGGRSGRQSTGEELSQDSDEEEDRLHAFFSSGSKRQRSSPAEMEVDTEEKEGEEDDSASVPTAATLLSREGRLKGSIVLAWVRDTLLASKLPSARQICGLLLRRFWSALISSDKALVLTALTSSLGVLPHHGLHAEEVFLFLEHICASPEFEAVSTKEISQELAKTLTSCLSNQSSCLENHPHTDLYKIIETLSENPQYVLEAEPCLSCISRRSATSTSTTAAAGVEAASSTTTDTLSSASSSSSSFRTIPLDSVRLAQRATENTVTVLLKTRQRVNRLMLRIQEPHGRLVKTIHISYCNRTAASLADLAAVEERYRWQRLAVLNLTPGQTNVETELPVPAIVGCLMIEYHDFYPVNGSSALARSAESRGGGSGASGGLNCPQCGRHVTDPHGFCRHCGEVAFQCRQCRHINYERLDAFLCVECGYIAYGQFSYRLSATSASTVISLTTEAECEEALKVYRTAATHLQEEQQRLIATLPELQRLVQELQATGNRGSIAAGPSSSLPSVGDIANAVAAVRDHVGMMLPSALLSTINGLPSSRGRGSSIETLITPPATKAARFVFTTEGLPDPETESRDDEEEELEEEVEVEAPAAAGIARRARLVAAAAAASTSTASSRHGLPQQRRPIVGSSSFASSSSTAGGSSSGTHTPPPTFQVNLLSDADPFERMMTGLPSTSSASPGTTSLERQSRLTGFRASAIESATGESSTTNPPPSSSSIYSSLASSSRLLAAARGGVPSSSTTYAGRPPPASSRSISGGSTGAGAGGGGGSGGAAGGGGNPGGTSSNSNFDGSGRGGGWSAVTAAALSTGSAKGQRVLDYYLKTCRPIHEKIAGYARDMFEASEELLAYHRHQEGLAHTSDDGQWTLNPRCRVGEDLADDEGGTGEEVMATSCYECGHRVITMLERILLTLAENGRCLDVLLRGDDEQERRGPSLLAVLIESLIHAPSSKVRQLARKIIKESWLVNGQHAAAPAFKARLYSSIVKGLNALMSSGPTYPVWERAVQDYMELVYELCAVNGLAVFNEDSSGPSLLREARQAKTVTAWADHLHLPVEILRHAAPLAETNLALSVHLVLPCLQLVMAVCYGKYPKTMVGGVYIDSTSVQVQAAVQSFTETVMKEMLTISNDWTVLTTGSAVSHKRWATVSQTRSYHLACRVIEKWQRKEIGQQVQQQQVRKHSIKDSSCSWWVRLLLNPHAVEVRKQAALLMVVMLQRMRSEEQRAQQVFAASSHAEAQSEEDEEEEEKEEEDCQDMEMENQTNNTNLTIRIGNSPSCGLVCLPSSPFPRLPSHALRHSLLRTQILDVLMSALDHAIIGQKMDDVSLQLFGLIRFMTISYSHAAFLAIRGAISFLCWAGRRNIARLRNQQSRVLAGVAGAEARDPGIVMLQLVEVLKALFQHKQVRLHRLQPHMTDLLRLVVDLKLSLVLQSSALEAAINVLQELITPPTPEASPSAVILLPAAGPTTSIATRQAERRAYLLAATELLRENHSERAKNLFLLKNMYTTICPPRKRPRYRIQLRRAPSQDEFFRGSLSRNPVWVSDIPMEGHGGSAGADGDGEPVMRDLRAMIARDLGIVDAMELLEFLVAGQIISLDIPIRLVFNNIWKPWIAEKHPDTFGINDAPIAPELFPSLLVTYRLAGVDGEATEEVVETLEDDEAESVSGRRSQEAAKVTEVVGEGKGLGVLLTLAKPPSESSCSAAEWEMASIASVILCHCAKSAANRSRLVALNGPAILLTHLLAVLRLSMSGGSASTSALQLTDRLLQVIEELGGNNSGSVGLSASSENDVTLSANDGGGEVVSSSQTATCQVTAFLDALSDSTLVEVLRSSVLTKAVGRLLPFLTYGREAACITLADRIQDEIDWTTLTQRQDEEEGKASSSRSQVNGAAEEGERLRVTVMLESLAGLEGNASGTAGEMLREQLVANGFTAGVIASVKVGLPEEGVGRAVAESMHRNEFLKRKEKVEASWKGALARPVLKLGLRVLTGLARGHAATQQLMLTAGILAVLHDIEELTSSGEVGSLAEELLEIVSAQSQEVATAVKALRQQTKTHKRRLAQQNRQQALSSMGLATTTALPSAGGSQQGTPSETGGAAGGGGGGASSAKAQGATPMEVDTAVNTSATSASEGRRGATAGGRGEQAQQAPRRSSGTAAAAGAGASVASRSSNSSSRPSSSSSSSAAAAAAGSSKWISDMEALEEEAGLACMVCQEGYTYKPKEVLGMYIYSKSVASLDVAALEGDALLHTSGAAAASRSVPPAAVDPSGRHLLEGSSSSSSSSRPSRYNCRVPTTVTAFNLIHFSCHGDACKADRALKQPKLEWDGAALRNSRVACNGMLPLRGPRTTAEAYRLAVEKHFSRLSAVTQQSPLSRPALVVHDIRFLVLRLAFQESLRDDCAGGSLSSNLKLLPYQVQLGHYVLERIAAGDESMGQASEVRRLEDSLQTFLQKGRALKTEGKSHPHRSAHETIDLAEAATLMPILGLLLLSREEWDQACSQVFLPMLMLNAGLRKARKEQGSGAITNRRRSRSFVGSSSSTTVAASSSTSAAATTTTAAVGNNNNSSTTSVSFSSSQGSDGGGGGVGRKRRRALSEGGELDVDSIGLMEGISPEEEKRAALEAARSLLIYLALLNDFVYRFKPLGSEWHPWSSGVSVTLYNNDQENVMKCEGLGEVYEKELIGKTTAEEGVGALWQRVKGVGGGGERENEKEEGEKEIVKLVLFGEKLLG